MQTPRRRKVVLIVIAAIAVAILGLTLAHVLVARRKYSIRVSPLAAKSGCNVHWGVEFTPWGSAQPSAYLDGERKEGCGERVMISNDIEVTCDCD